MIVSSWNIRGLNYPTKKEAIHTYLRRNKVAIMAILETRIREGNLHSSRSFARNWSMDSNVGLASNIRNVLLWNVRDVDVEVLWKDDQCLHCYVKGRSLPFRGFISFIYARNTNAERKVLWSKLCT